MTLALDPVVDGDGGIWRLRPAGQYVELRRTTTTDVVRELVALCEAGRTGNPGGA